MGTWTDHLTTDRYFRGQAGREFQAVSGASAQLIPNVWHSHSAQSLSSISPSSCPFIHPDLVVYLTSVVLHLFPKVFPQRGSVASSRLWSCNSALLTSSSAPTETHTSYWITCNHPLCICISVLPLPSGRLWKKNLLERCCGLFNFLIIMWSTYMYMYRYNYCVKCDLWELILGAWTGIK